MGFRGRDKNDSQGNRKPPEPFFRRVGREKDGMSLYWKKTTLAQDGYGLRVTVCAGGQFAGGRLF